MPEHAPGARAPAGADQPARAAALPRERRRVEHAGVRAGLLMQGERADGADDGLPRLVEKGVVPLFEKGVRPLFLRIDLCFL